MNDPIQVPLRDRFVHALSQRLSLRADQADAHAIDRAFREGIEFRGTNVWLLVAAIFIASIGLNVNSTAVIIGAMLISPLMGPIMGIGYGVAIGDFELLKRAFRALTIAVAASLLTSTAYFLLSPLAEAQSELLTRTTPTLWDLLVALFGGLVGAVGATRREKSNVVPGVAIATALMPPLCTAGYGIATGQPGYFLGAFYLFFINSVYIGLATAVVLGLMGQRAASDLHGTVRRRLRWTIYALVVATVVPSVVLSWRLVSAEWFQRRAQRFLSQELNLPGVHIADRKILPELQRIEVALLGARLPAAKIAALQAALPKYRLDAVRLVVRQVGDPRVDATSQRTVALGEMLSGSQVTLSAHDQRLAALEQELARQAQEAREARALADQLQGQLARVEQQRATDLANAATEVQLHAELAREVAQQFPQVIQVDVHLGWRQSAGGQPPARLAVVKLVAGPGQQAPDASLVAEFLGGKMPGVQVEVLVERLGRRGSGGR